MAAKDEEIDQAMIRVPRHVARLLKILAAENGVTVGRVAAAVLEDERKVRNDVKASIARAGK